MDPRHPNQQQQHQQQQPPHRPPSHHSPPLHGPSARDNPSSFDSFGTGRRPSDRFSRQPDHPVHSRAQSASSLPSAHELSRAMPPPNSPPQGQGHGQHFGPPPPRAPPLAVGPPSAFPTGRELPALSSLTRSEE